MGGRFFKRSYAVNSVETINALSELRTTFALLNVLYQVNWNQSQEFRVLLVFLGNCHLSVQILSLCGTGLKQY